MKLFQALNKLLLTKRVFVFGLTLVFLSIAFFVSVSSMLSDLDYQYFYHQSLARDYFQNGLVYHKWITMIIVLFLSTHTFAYNQFDWLFISHQSKYKYILIKLGTVLAINTTLILCIELLFLIVSYLTIYYDIGKVDYLLCIYVIIQGNYYLLLSIFFYKVLKHLVGVFIPFIGFILTFILTESGIVIYEINGFTALLHIMFPDFIFTNDEKIQFLYGFSLLSLLTIIYILVICEKHKMLE